MIRPPNILWLMTDEQRNDSLGCSGSPWAHTPNLDRLACSQTQFLPPQKPERDFTGQYDFDILTHIDVHAVKNR